MKLKKLTAVLLVVAMTLSLAACGTSSGEESTESGSSSNSEATGTERTTYVRTGDYDADSAALYDEALGEFYEYYQAAKEATDLSTRYALMAIAEAKLLEACVYLPTTDSGGAYALRRYAPYGASTITYGTSSDRYENMIPTEELVTADDWAALKELWSEVRGTGTYTDAAAAYLEEQGYTLKDTLTLTYSSDPTTWDSLISYLEVNSEYAVNTYEYLVMYDSENELQPALAESWEVSDDGLTYTFHLREGLTWVDSQGRYLADLTADDFVAGLQHFLDGGSGAEWLAGSDGMKIVNADAYTNGEISDFSEVGIEAVDEYTLVYTLEDECLAFLTMLTYSNALPLCRSYFESLGGGFGADYDSESCTYGLDPDSIAYCGPYLVSNFTSENKMEFTANPSYWNADNIRIQTLTYIYNDGTDPRRAYDLVIDGTIDGCSLNTSTVEIAQSDGYFDDYAVISGLSGISFGFFDNINRQAFTNYNDETVGVSAKIDDEDAQEDTYVAMNNLHFRRALAFAFDQTTYNEQFYGSDLAAVSLINSYVPGTFGVLEEEVTVDINGTATTFAAGTYYGEILQAQIDADEFPVTVWDPDGDDGIGSSAGFDGWYNPEEAAAELALAIEELAAEGIEISADNPIVLDVACYTASESYLNAGNAMKQSIESALDGCVVINLVEYTDITDWYYSQYYATAGSEMNFDIGTLSGWSADYGDPASFLDTFLPDYAGYCTMSIGIY